MDLKDQTVSNTNEICVQDSLNASLMKLKVKMGATSVAPSNNDLIVYVDKQSSSNPTLERKQYVFNLIEPLKYCNEISDELIQQFKMVDNKVEIETFVKRRVGTNEMGDYILEASTTEELDANIITLFEGVNYIYTNYTNEELELIYPKDNEVTRIFLNNATFYEHLMNDEDDFNLDDIYFKDAFTQSGDKLNLEVDNACVECITSKNNKFSLDSEGNLIVNSITTNEEVKPTLDNTTICNIIYPVGSIYMSVNSTSPSTLFGGTWSRINGYYLYAGTTAGSNKSGASSGSTGGVHCHIEVGKGKQKTWIPNEHNVYCIPNQIPLEKVFFMNNTNILLGVADWKYLEDVIISTNEKKYINLNPLADTWRIYDLGVHPKAQNAKNTLKPFKFGGLSYTICGYEDDGNTVIIETAQFGKIKIYIKHKLASITDTPIYNLIK